MSKSIPQPPCPTFHGAHALSRTARFQNAFDQPLLVSCGHKQALQAVSSYHNNHAEDRQWQWDCRTVAQVDFSYCYWSDYQNDFDQPFVFECPNNRVLTGVSSHHDNGAEDRRWKFRCCEAPNHIKENCDWTGYINSFDGQMNYNLIGTPRVFVGAFSYHSNNAE